MIIKKWGQQDNQPTIVDQVFKLERRVGCSFVVLISAKHSLHGMVET